MLKPATKCAQHRAGVARFWIESITSFRVCFHIWIHITARDHPENGEKPTCSSNAAISESIVGIRLCQPSQLLLGGVQCFRRLLVNQKSSSQVPCICVKIRRGPP